MKKIVFNILSTIVGLVFINSGLNKFLNYMPVPDNLPEGLLKDSMAMMEISWLMPLVAVVEIIGGLLLLFPKTKPIGVLTILPIMAGILCVHFTVAPDGLPIALALFAVLLWMIYEYRNKYLNLLD